VPQNELSNCFLLIDSNTSKRNSGNVPSTNSISDILYFTSMPDDIGTSKIANVAQTTILGRTESIKTYGSSGGRAWNLNLQFFAEDTGYAAVKTAVTAKLNWCESLVHTQYVNGLSQGLPILLFQFGDYISVRVICTSVSTSIIGPWLVDTGTLQSRTTQQVGPPAPTTFGPGGSSERLGDIVLPLFGTAHLILEDLGDRSWGFDEVRRGKHLGQL
jgi:hypothetical protein